MMTTDPREELEQLRDQLPGLEAELAANAAETADLAAELSTERPADTLAVAAEFDADGLPAALRITAAAAPAPTAATFGCYDDEDAAEPEAIAPDALAAAILTALRPRQEVRPIPRFELPYGITDADLQPLDIGAARARLRDLAAAADRLVDGDAGSDAGREFGDDFGGFTLRADRGSVLSLEISERWLRSTPLTTVGEEIARIARLAIVETRTGDDR